MTDERDPYVSRRGSGCLAALGWLFVVALAGVTIGLAAVSGLLGTGPFPVAVRQAALFVGSEVATSARSVLPLGEHAFTSADSPIAHPHIVPSNGPAIHAHGLTFAFEGKEYTITPHVASAVYWGAKHSTRYLVQFQGQSDDEWTRAYYRAFADDPAQSAAIDDTCRQLRSIRARAGLDSDEYLELMAKFVQSIPYDWKNYKQGTGTQRFPVQTLVDGTGLCGDKSVLLADLLAHEGYSATLLDFGPEKHMAVGVTGPGTTFMSTGHLFLETTGPIYVTDVPAQYTGGMRLESEPLVIPVGQGRLEYTAAGQIAELIAAREAATPAAEALFRQAKQMQLTPAQAHSINLRLRLAYEAETSLRSNVVDRKGDSVGAFKDRVVALRWIKRNAWWM